MSKRYVRMNFEGTQTAKTSCIGRSNNPSIDFTELAMPRPQKKRAFKRLVLSRTNCTGQPVAVGRYLHSTLSWIFVVSCSTLEVSNRLQPPTPINPPTSWGLEALSTQKTILIHNNSEIPVDFSWRAFPSIQEEISQKLKLQVMPFRGKGDEIRFDDWMTLEGVYMWKTGCFMIDWFIIMYY